MRIRCLICLVLSTVTLHARAELRYADIAPIVTAKCAVCHRGPFLNLSRFPFEWDQSADLEVLGKEMRRRIESTGKGHMPPANGTALTPDERTQLVDWLSGGMVP